MSVPIVNAQRQIVGWTDTLPENISATMRHPDAEKLVGGQVTAAFVGIDDPETAKRAGAPEDWKGTWRCIGLCSMAAFSRSEDGYLVVGSRRPAPQNS
jgi:hypothetical protein